MRTISMDGTASMISSANARLRFRRGAERGAAADGLFDGLDNARMGVAENERSPGADVIEILVAVDVVEIRPFAAGDEERLTADAPKARAGLLTPPGMTRLARSKASRLWVRFIDIINHSRIKSLCKKVSGTLKLQRFQTPFRTGSNAVSS